MMATPDAAHSSSTAPTRCWALDSKDTPIRVKPRRPYTPYNLFYLLERELVVQGQDSAAAKEKTMKMATLAAERKASHGDRAEDDIAIPARYKGVVLLPMWYEPNLKEKRKHRKTHGKISFKDLTQIISKNWSEIDKETKGYCTSVSEMGRKRYKETMSRYNASQKILQLKKEHAAMESAREKRMEPFKSIKKECSSPPRSDVKKGKKNPATPDRILSHQAPIVTPTSSGGYNNRVPMFVPSGAHAAFHHYGPPPPMPPPMPHSHSMQGQPRSMQGQLPPPMPMYHQHHQHHHHPHYSYPQAPAMNKMNNSDHNQVMKSNNMEQYTGRNGGNYFNISNLPSGPGVDVNVNVNVSLKKHDVASSGSSKSDIPSIGFNLLGNPSSHSAKRNMTHDDAMQLYTQLRNNESPGKMSIHRDSFTCVKDHVAPLNDTLLQEMPSFDFGDHHSLSTEDGDTNSECVVDGILGQFENQNGILDLIRGELLPLGEDDGFPDITFHH